MTSTRPSTGTPSRTRQFSTSKLGHTLDECEDALGTNLTTNRFAVADGATEAFDSGKWARQLAHDWVNQQGLLDSNQLWEWIGQQGTVLTESWAGLKMSWYAEEKARAGSFAALVGIELDLMGSRWRGIALGDSCFFHFRNRELIATMPDLTEYIFSSNPVLAPSLTALQSHASKAIMTNQGELQLSDILVLCSDALAAWLAERSDSSGIIDFFFGGSDQELQEFLDYERTSGRLKDDDLSLIVIEV